MIRAEPCKSFAKFWRGFAATFFIMSVAAGAQPAGNRVQIKGGQTVRVAAAGQPEFSLRFVSVVSDERCPARVKCAWANPPVISLEASAPGQATQTLTITENGPEGPKQGQYLGVTVDYADLIPVPQEIAEFSKLKPLDVYTVTLIIGGPVAKPRR